MLDDKPSSEKLLNKAFGYFWFSQDSFSIHLRTSFLLNFTLVMIVFYTSAVDFSIWFFLLISAVMSLIVSVISVAIQDVYLGMSIKDKKKLEIHSLDLAGHKIKLHEQWANSVPRRLIVATVSSSVVWLVLILAALIF